jgi:hypothetical protein
MSKALRAKKPHKHPCPTCKKPVMCWWADHGDEARSGDTCDDCLQKDLTNN